MSDTGTNVLPLPKNAFVLAVSAASRSPPTFASKFDLIETQWNDI